MDNVAVKSSLEGVDVMNVSMELSIFSDHLSLDASSVVATLEDHQAIFVTNKAESVDAIQELHREIVHDHYNFITIQHCISLNMNMKTE
jgi:hypothetical protein